MAWLVTTGWAPVVVREVEVGDPAIDGQPDDRPLNRQRPILAEVLPADPALLADMWNATWEAGVADATRLN